MMIAPFATGAITRTVLSFEMGVLWSNFTATLGGHDADRTRRQHQLDC
jgi:hypothetical protein